MLFNSFEFMLFFPSVVLLHFAVPQRYRWVVLLPASYGFYMAWKPGYVVLIWLSTLVDYFAGLGFGRLDRKGLRRLLLMGSLLTNLGLLFVFKYYGFFAANLDPLLPYLGWTFHLPDAPWVLPVGISFYTFQTLAYTIEVYRGTQAPERHLGRFALYVAFFPQLVAGPIERARNLLPQFSEHHGFDYARVTEGLRLMAWGLFKKVVIADRLAEVVDTVYGNPEAATGPAVVVATVFYAFQIYCDFSGYSDIAIGAARVLGYRLMENFRRPYFAISIADFWRRWHISLSTWFRDYLYIPLGGSRVTAPRWCTNIVIVFLLSGLWHGANWTFLAWGALHAVYLLVGRAMAPFWARLGEGELVRLLRGVGVFGLVCFAWIFFRAQSVGDAFTLIRALSGGWSSPPVLGVSAVTFVLLAGLVGFLLAVQWAQTWDSLHERFTRQPTWVRWGVYSAALWGVFLLGALKQTQFIYFVF